MKTKLIYFSNQQIKWVQKDADEREISFTEMVRRILDQHYELTLVSRKDSHFDSTNNMTSLTEATFWHNYADSSRN
jgi:hypothetical protein